MDNSIVAAQLLVGLSLISASIGRGDETGQGGEATTTDPVGASPAKEWPAEPLRGMSVYPPRGGVLDDATFLKLKEWNVNLIRVAISVDEDSIWSAKKLTAGQAMPPIPAEDPLRPYANNLIALDSALELAAKHHVFVVPVVADVVGRSNDVMYQHSDGAGFYGEVIKLWRHIARRHGTNPWLIGYDILNEPHGSESESWPAMSQRIIAAIREIDADTYLVYEPAPWALPDQAFKDLEPIDDPRVVYSCHFYYPHSYTHQGIHNYKGPKYEGKAYPGELRLFDGAPTFWDQAALEASMEHVIAFQRKHQAKILVGEFSVIRWAPGAAQWLDDTIGLFEKYGWSWNFHCYGEWNGWNPTFAPDDPSSNERDGGQVTDRLEVLLRALETNRRY